MESIIKRVGIYCRISYNKTGDTRGVDRQERDCRDLAARRGWEVVNVYDDDDKSAWQQGVIRKSFDQLVSDIATGVIDGVVFYHMDRVAKESMAFARLVSHYEKDKAGVLVSDSVHGGLDLSDPQQRAIAALQALLGGAESSATSRRMKDYLRNEALSGRVISNYPAFYRNRDGSINPEKQRIILKAVDDILTSDGRVRPTAIAEEWRSKGITTARGGRVTAETVRRILVAPGMAGFAVYKGEILTGDDGQPIKRLDGGVVDEATWRLLIEKIRIRPKVGDRRVKGLLSKSLRCGRCGAGMVRFTRPSGWYGYNCRSKDSGGCASCSISGPKLDEQIITLVLEILNEPYEAPEEKPFAGQARLDEVTTKIAEVREHFISEKLSGSLAFPMLTTLENEQKQLQAQAAKHHKTKRPVVMTAADQWDTMSLAHKQAVVDQLFEAIVIDPAKPKAKGEQSTYDPMRVNVIRRSLSLQSLQQLYDLLCSEVAVDTTHGHISWSTPNVKECSNSSSVIQSAARNRLPVGNTKLQQRTAGSTSPRGH